MSLVLESRRSVRLRLIRKTALSIAVLVLCLVFTYTAFSRWTLVTAPDDDGPTLPQKVRVESTDSGNRMQVGKSTLARRDGLWRLELTGSPRLVGHAHGLLVRRLSDRFEQHMASLLHSHVPGAFSRWLVGNVVRWRYRHLAEEIPPRHLVELAALSRTLVDTEDYLEQPFQRLVYYHALYDITQRLERSPLLSCTAFAASAPYVSSGHLLVGRNFDFDAGRIFDEEKAVLVYRQKDVHAFVSVAWPGMIGVVTGINAKRLLVTLNAARTDDGQQEGIPSVFLVREILERAATIKEALALIKTKKVMSAQSLLIASGSESRAVVVELSPRRLAVREMKNGAVGVANHFLHRKFKGDANNDRLRRYTTSEDRYRRLMQLLRRFRGRLDPQTAALLLRNRTGIDDEPLPLGHSRAIDALNATHAIVVDLDEVVLWVSKGPHLLGEFVPIDLKPLLRLPTGTEQKPPKPIAADPLLDSSDLRRLELARSQMAHVEQLRRAEAPSNAIIDYARRAADGMPKLPKARLLLGDVLWDAGQHKKATKHYERYLELHPPYRGEVERVKARLGR